MEIKRVTIEFDLPTELIKLNDVDAIKELKMSMIYERMKNKAGYNIELINNSIDIIFDRVNNKIICNG